MIAVGTCEELSGVGLQKDFSRQALDKGKGGGRMGSSGGQFTTFGWKLRVAHRPDGGL